MSLSVARPHVFSAAFFITYKFHFSRQLSFAFYCAAGTITNLESRAKSLKKFSKLFCLTKSLRVFFARLEEKHKFFFAKGCHLSYLFTVFLYGCNYSVLFKLAEEREIGQLNKPS